MKNPLPLAEAEQLAEWLQVNIERSLPFNRVLVAGSVRRRKPLVGDIELVADATPSDLFGLTEATKIYLRRLGVSRAPPTVRKDGVETKAPWSDRYLKSVLTFKGQEVQLDLFIARPPASFAVVFLIRTGSAEFSQAVVTRLHRYGLKSEDGRIVDIETGETQFTPSEQAVFDLAHLPFVMPEKRDMELPETLGLFL